MLTSPGFITISFVEPAHVFWQAGSQSPAMLIIRYRIILSVLKRHRVLYIKYRAKTHSSYTISNPYHNKESTLKTILPIEFKFEVRKFGAGTIKEVNIPFNAIRLFGLCRPLGGKVTRSSLQNCHTPCDMSVR